MTFRTFRCRRRSAIDRKSLTTTCIEIRREWLDRPVSATMEANALKHKPGFTERPYQASAATHMVGKFGRVAKLTHPIACHDLRRGFVQDVRALSDSRVSREAVGHADEKTHKKYLHNGRQSDQEWSSRRLVEGETGEVLPPVLKKCRNDILLPNTQERQALQQVSASHLNVKVQSAFKRKAQSDRL